MPRRSLDFKTLEEMKNDVVTLSQGQYVRSGKWSLGQVADHIAFFFESSMDGFNLTLPWYIRAVGPVAKRITLWRRSIPRIKGPDVLMPPAEMADDAVGLARFHRAYDRYIAFQGPLKPSPLFGQLTREEWDQIHLIHGGHHLSFLRRA